eukprot:3997755-Heterocapsa_arctica.AAC.1
MTCFLKGDKFYKKYDNENEFIKSGFLMDAAIGVNKMDRDTAGYKQSSYDEIANEIINMFVNCGYKNGF